MRIGIVAPPWLPVPPTSYGGIEAVVDGLARGLHRMGHDVRLFTVAESTCPVRRLALFAQGQDDMGLALPEAAHVVAAYDALQDCDVIHDHTLLGPLIGPLAVRSPARPAPPVLVTHHNPFTPEAARVLGVVARQATVVAVSHAHARSAHGVPVGAVVHHGVDLRRYHPRADGDRGYLLFLGRMSPDKGVHRAVRVAARTGRRLVIATKMRHPDEVAYYERDVAPLLGPHAEPPREAGLDEATALLAGATALLNPITWPEPFGLVMIEALASGTPVIAFPHGAAPEIVEHGRTGFLCGDEDAMVEAVRRVGEIDRRDCRTAAERRFSTERMARDYLGLYLRVRRAAQRVPALVP
ncbi:MAG: glycosyltransferase family 4 protein [Angustibacter sp.]